MKKVIIPALAALMMAGCGNQTSSHTQETPKRYEVLLPTKDIIHVEADSYYMYYGYFGTNTEPDCIFEDRHGNRIQVIHNPVYVKETRTR